jgi:hypothetical protein
MIQRIGLKPKWMTRQAIELITAVRLGFESCEPCQVGVLGWQILV